MKKDRSDRQHWDKGDVQCRMSQCWNCKHSYFGEWCEAFDSLRPEKYSSPSANNECPKKEIKEEYIGFDVSNNKI